MVKVVSSSRRDDALVDNSEDALNDNSEDVLVDNAALGGDD